MSRFKSRIFATVLLVVAQVVLTSPAQALTPEEICATDLSALHVTANEDFVGTSGNDLICGTEFDDVIDGGAGDDTIYGFAGDDTIESGDGNDIVDAGDGSDHVDGELGNDLITLGDGDDYAEGGAGADKLWGGDGSDALIGEAGNDWADGAEGNDEIKLDAGDDYALGGPGADLLLGGNGKDALYAQAGSDSLDGGAGVDVVDGGVGAPSDRDYCAKDTSDKQKHCFYDSKAPTLNSIAIVGSNSIDTSQEGKTITIRANVRDAGSGLANLSLAFSRLGSKGQPIGNIVNLNWNTWMPQCTDGVSSQTVNTWSGCQIAGDNFNGIYELKTQLPKYLPAGTYLLVNAYASDASNNSLQLDYQKLKTRKQAINFKQIGTGDDAGPVLRSISIANPSVNTSQSAQVVKLRFAISDAVSGNQSATFNFNYQTTSVTNFQTVQFSWSANYENDGTTLRLCENGAAPEPTTSMAFTSCAVSGSGNSAVVEAKALLPAYAPKGSYVLQNIFMSDRAGNNRQYVSTQIAKAKFAVSFKQTGAGDSVGPTIKEVQVVTPTVDTGTEAQIVTIKVRAADAVSGIKHLNLNVQRRTGSNFPYTNGAVSFGGYFAPYSNWLNGVETVYDTGRCTDDGLHAIEPNLLDAWVMPTSCRVAGSKQSGWFEFKIILPAHSAAGTYEIINFSSTDYANNSANLSYDKIVKLKLNKTFKNG